MPMGNRHVAVRMHRGLPEGSAVVLRLDYMLNESWPLLSASFFRALIAAVAPASATVDD